MFGRSVLKEAASRPRFSRDWWLVGTLKSALALLLVCMPTLYVLEHYRIEHNIVKDAHCLPYDWFLIDLAERSVGRGDYVWFTALNMEPFYPKGTRAVKIVMGVPGDRIQVNARGVWVNSVLCGSLFHARPGGRLAGLGHHESEYFRDEIVPAHHLWVMGTSRDSFDSRYWGYIADQQVLNRAHPLW